MKKAFSLLELIFVIVVIGIIASFAVPKFLDTKDSAQISTLKRDISSIISSIQTYHIQRGDIEKISDAITLNKKNWLIEDLKISDINKCLSIEVTEEDGLKTLKLDVPSDNTKAICVKIRDNGIETTVYELI